jgi:hypothetical protein
VLNDRFTFFVSCQTVTVSRQRVTALQFQEKNNMLVFKTPMSDFITVGCNQITKLRIVVTLPSSATIDCSLRITTMSRLRFTLPGSLLQIGTSFDVLSWQVIHY